VVNVRFTPDSRIASQNVQLASHPASAPAGGTAGVSSHAGTIHHVHSRPTCFAHSSDHLVRLVEGCEWHSLCEWRQCQSKGKRDQPHHCFSPICPAR